MFYGQWSYSVAARGMVSRTGHSRGFLLTRHLFHTSTMVTYSSVVVLGSTAWHGLGVGSFAWNSLAPLSVSGIPCGASNMVSGPTWWAY